MYNRIANPGNPILLNWSEGQDNDRVTTWDKNLTESSFVISANSVRYSLGCLAEGIIQINPPPFDQNALLG